MSNSLFFAPPRRLNMPDWKEEITQQLASLNLPPAREAEIVEEVAQHLDDRYRELLVGGAREDEARRTVLAEISEEKLLAKGLEKVEYQEPQEQVVLRGRGRKNIMAGLGQDTRYALRMLRKNPGFTAVAIVTLALGIGANTTVFSLADALLLRPFPVAEPARLVSLMRQNVDQPTEYSSFSGPDFHDFREQMKSFSALAAHCGVTVSMTLNREALRTDGEIVSSNYFSVLGVKPAVGRTFLPEEDQEPGAHLVAVLSADFWKSRFNSDRAIVGKSITINGHRFTVVGVAPAGFRGLSVGTSPAFWVPLATYRQVMPTFTFEGKWLVSVRGCDWLDLVGRLQPGRSVADAQAEAKILAGREAVAFPEDRKGWTAVASSLTSVRLMPWNADLKAMVGLLMAVVAMVLLIACSNVAGLLLARASARRLEIGIRTGLGAGRSRLIRQLLTESVLLAALGGGAAIALAPVATRLLATIQLPQIDMAGLDLRLDWRVLSYSLILAMVTAMIFGVIPALETSKTDLATTLKESSRTTGERRAFLRQTLVVSQIALSLLLVVSAGLFLRTLRNVLRANLGFEPRNVLIASVDLGLEGYTEPRARQFYQQVLERVQHSVGVRSACWASSAPLSIRHTADDVILEEGGSGRAPTINADGNWVGPGCFATLGIPLIAGRDFAPQDRDVTPRVAIVNESTARHFWPGENPLGQSFWLHARGGQPSLEVIGVVKDGKYSCSWCNLRTNFRPFMFLPFNETFQPNGTLLVKGEESFGGLAGSVREDVQAFDPNLPIFDVKTLEQGYRDGFLLQRVGALLVGVFGALALGLAAVGLFGLISFSVGQRTHEFGLRMALGAQRHDVIKLVLRQGLALIAVGVAAGLAGAVGLMRLMSSFLYGVTPTDPLTLALATLTLGGVAFLACYIPARRATKVDPIVALRYE
jgi:predicted permease